MMEKREAEAEATQAHQQTRLTTTTTAGNVDESGEFVLAHEIVRVLSAGGLDKYTEIFTQEEIDLESFLMLNDADLRNMNIPTGPRKKILKKIQHLREKHPGLLASSPGSPAGSYMRSPPSSLPSSLSSSCSPPSTAFSSPAHTSPVHTAISTPSSSSPVSSTGSLSIPASTPPPSPIVSPLLHFTSSSHYSAINDDDLQKGRSLSVDTLSRQAIEPRAGHRRDHAGGQPIKRFMSESPTTSRLLGSPHHSAVPVTTPPQPRRVPGPGHSAEPDVRGGSSSITGQRKFSLPSPNHHTAPYDRPENDAIDSAGSAYAGITSAVDDRNPSARRQRAFALSYLPKDATTTEASFSSSAQSNNKSEHRKQQSTTTVPTETLASTSSYSVLEGSNRAKQHSEPAAVELRLSSSQPSRSFMPRDRIESRILRAKWEIEFDELVLEEKIGSGNFGVVWRAKWRNSPCVVKRLKDKAIQEQLLQEFREESRVWMNIRPHANVVQFLGASSKVPNICIVTEYLPLGDARQLVKSQSIPLKSKLHLLLGIAAGVCHLHREGVVHRDLACRNVMVTKNINGEYDAKVGDFGLSRLGQEGIYTSSTGEGPLKWMPPEAINPHQRIFSLKSDSWSFGVVVWEILMDGAEPFGNDDAVTAGLRILKGDRLQLPAHTPAPMAALVRDCWHEKDDLRPDFDVICRRMQDICASFAIADALPRPPPSAVERSTKPFGKTLAELEGPAGGDGMRRSNELVELMIKKGIITDSPEKKRQLPANASAWSGGVYDKIATGSISSSNDSTGSSYGRINESSSNGGAAGSYGSISAASSTAVTPSGRRDPRRASVNLGSGRALNREPATLVLKEADTSKDNDKGLAVQRDKDNGNDSNNIAAQGRSEPTSPVRPRPRSVALTAEHHPDNIDWRYQGQQGGTQLSGRMSLRFNKRTEGQASPDGETGGEDKPVRKAWFAVEGKNRGDRENLGMLGQRRSSLSPSAGYDGAFALLAEREIYLIIHYLDAASLRNLSVVSRQWRQLFDSPALWRFLFKKRQRAAGVDGLVLRRRRRSTLTKNESGEIETRRRRQSYEASVGHGAQDTELFAHFVMKLITRSLCWQQADDGSDSRALINNFSWHRLYIAYFEPWKLPSPAALFGSGDPITPRGSGSGSGRSSREPSTREPSIPCITIGQRTADPPPFKIGMYGMDGVEITSLVTAFVEHSLPRSRSGSGSPRRMYVGAAFSMAKLLSESVLLASAHASLSTATGVGFTQTHAVQTLGDVNPRAAVQSQQGSYRVESEVDGLRSFFDVNLATYAKDNARFQKLADRELFCLCYDPNDIQSFFFAISLFYELFDEGGSADGTSLRIPPLFLVARSTTATPTGSQSATAPDRTVTMREGKMLASILCCPFYALATASTQVINAESTRLLFHSMAREVRLTREGYTTRFRKACDASASSSSPSPGAMALRASGHQGSPLRESQSGRMMVVKDDLYIGQVGEKSQERCGVGIAWMKASRELYMGEWRDDMPHGWGVLYSPRDGRRVWAGSWMAGRALSSAVDLALDVAPSSPSTNNTRRSK